MIFLSLFCPAGISQRDVTRRYPELQSELDSISDRIQTFHDSHIAGRFPLQRYTYDCYVPTSPGSNVRLIDFNPAGGTTAPLLFAWEELLADSAATQQEHDVQEDTTCSSTHKTGVRDREDVGEGSGGMRGGSEGMSAAAELRIITDDVAMRPDTAVFGVPYDFVDGSEGSALSTLLEQAKQAGAGDLFEALNQQTKQQRMRDGAG